jgi:prepilin-type N-terminal cleavage/methylation domain-containing protein
MKKFFNDKGLSLIEMLIAMLVLSVVVTGFAGLFTQSFQNVYSAGYKSEAQHVAQVAMENLQADLSYSHAEATVSETVNTATLVMSFDGYGTVTVPGQEVVVTVEYTDGGGNNRTQVFKSFTPDN